MIRNERDLEDRLEELGPLVVGVENARCVARQLTLPSGQRLDLLYAHVREDGERVWTVAEVKYGEAGMAAAVQLAGYMTELRSGMAVGAQEVIAVQGVIAAPWFSDDLWMISDYLRPHIELCVIEVRVEPMPLGRDEVVVPGTPGPGFERVPEVIRSLEVRHERMDRALEGVAPDRYAGSHPQTRIILESRAAKKAADRP